MELLIVSFLAGVLSVLAPCVVSLLPVLVGRSAEGKNELRAIRIVLGLGVSVMVFTLLLKASTSLIGIPQQFWQTISGVIILLFGISMLAPITWEIIASRLKLQKLSGKGQQAANKRGGNVGDLLLGASLGPIFSACSPTYALIVAVVLPTSFIKGLGYLIAFILGLSVTILVIALSGQALVKKLGWSVNPKGWFKRTLGVLFILTGLLFITGLDKKIETYFVQNGAFDWQVNLESKLQR